MFVTKSKNVPAVVLVVGLALAGIGAGLIRQTQAAQPQAKEEQQPKAKEEQPDPKKVLTPEEAIKQMPKEKVTVQFKVASVEVTGWYLGYPATYYVHLKDGGKFTAWVNAHHGFNDEDQIQKLVKKLGIKSVTDLSGKVVRVTGQVWEGGMWVHDPANNVEVVKPKTDAKEQKPNEEQQPQAKAEQPDKTDQERMVGNWYITNDDSLRKGEMWVITADSILMYAKHGGANAHRYLHRTGAGKDPKQIDITVTLVNGTPVGIIKGLYALAGDELRLCLAAPGKDRPAKFPEKPAPGEVLILQRDTGGGRPRAAKAAQPAKTDQERVVGNWIIMNDDSKRKGEAWVINEDSILMNPMHGGINGNRYLHRLDAGKDPKQIDITVTLVKGPTVGVIKGLYALDGDELRLCLAPLDKDRPAAFPKKPEPGEVLILQRATSGATPPAAKEALPIKTDRERMVGEWVIKNADSKGQGQRWVINKDHILMNYYGPGAIPYHYHFLDAGKDPKQIDIALTKVNGPEAIKGIYVLDGDELRLCLGERGKDRPAKFPEKPAPGQVLILQRAPEPAAGEPKAREEQPATKDQPTSAKSEVKVLTPAEAITQRPEKVTVQFKVAAVQATPTPRGGFGTDVILLKDGGSFSVRLVEPARAAILRLGIEPDKHFMGRLVRVTGLVQPDSAGSSFHIRVDDLTQLLVFKE